MKKLLLIFIMALSLGAGELEKKEKQFLKSLLTALEDNSHAKFIADGNKAFKQGINVKVFESVQKQIGASLKAGYHLEYLAELKQNGMEVYLWKISYKRQKQDTLAKSVIHQDKVAGFWLQ